MLKYLALLVALVLLFPPAAASAQTTCQDPSDESGLDVINQGYTLLSRYYVNALPASTWLAAASDAANTEIQSEDPDSTASISITDWPDSPDADWSTFADQFCAALDDSQDDALDPDQIAQAAVNGMAQAADEQHTNFLTPSAYSEQLDFEAGKESYAGIGARIQSDPLAIGYIFPGSPADQAGLQEGDLIIDIDGQSASDLTPEQVASMVRGDPGTTVTLTVMRDGWDSPQDFPIVRAKIDVPLITTDVINNIGYIQLMGFTGPQAYEDVANAIDQFESQDLDAIVLDLRGNPGGRIDVGTRIAGLFMPDGTPVLQQTTRRGRTTTVRTIGAPSWTKPLAVLVDGSTASMGEILTAALQEEGDAEVFGQTTAGAVAGSLIFPLPDGAALQITTVRVTSGLGEVLNDVGVQPDVDVSGRDPAAPSDDAALGAAVNYLESEVAAENNTATGTGTAN